MNSDIIKIQMEIVKAQMEMALRRNKNTNVVRNLRRKLAKMYAKT